MKRFRSIVLGAAAAYMVALVCTSVTTAAPTNSGDESSVANYIEFNESTTVESGESLDDWEFTLRRRPPKCRFNR